VEGEDAEIGERANDPPPDPLVDYPDPQSCEDIDFQLREALQRKEFYDDLNGLIASVSDLEDHIDDLRSWALAAGLVTVAGWVERYNAAVSAAIRWVGTRPFAVAQVSLLLLSMGTEGAWDQHINKLRTLQEEWDCST